MSESGSSAPASTSERPRPARRPTLIAPPFAAIVRGRDGAGSRFAENGTLDDMRAHSLSLRLGRDLRPGSTLFIVISIGSGHPDGPLAPAVAIRGKVTQVTRQPLSGYTVTVSFDRYRFLFVPHPA